MEPDLDHLVVKKYTRNFKTSHLNNIKGQSKIRQLDIVSAYHAAYFRMEWILFWKS
jgi:hypothetical protein